MERQQEVPRQLRKLVRGAREWYKWSTAVHERCTRLQSGAQARVVHDGARDYVVVHEIAEWCMMVHE